MEDRFDICLAFTLREEGGYVDDPADPGGATNMGITLATYREWCDDPHLGDLQVKDMTPKTARAIYRSLYWDPLRADALRRASISVYLTWVSMPVSGGRPDYCSERSASLETRWTAR
jgi:lysozyme family protein